jgi:meso-butanediol dehydrogenase / (S,S)-butanediol dehydrogenase / diacetyl reductase
MAAVMEFLISPAASYVNGHAMVADGGTINGTGLAAPASGQGRVMPDH